MDIYLTGTEGESVRPGHCTQQQHWHKDTQTVCSAFTAGTDGYTVKKCPFRQGGSDLFSKYQAQSTPAALLILKHGLPTQPVSDVAAGVSRQLSKLKHTCCDITERGVARCATCRSFSCKISQHYCLFVILCMMNTFNTMTRKYLKCQLYPFYTPLLWAVKIKLT